MVFRAKLSKGGKLSIPAACRKYLNLQDGEEIICNIKEGEIILSPLKFKLQKARKIINKYHADTNLVDKLINERKKEAANE